uniref:Enoyl reductase (ER) domain-containing protein n=1 Tax=Romanomermis culicivorax TaxID=13658 RepID=A0A915IZX5_ROMCU
MQILAKFGVHKWRRAFLVALPKSNFASTVKPTTIPDLFYYSTLQEDRNIIVRNRHSSSEIRRMQAIRVHEFGGEDKLRFEDDVILPKLEDDKILIRIHAAGVNPVDTYIRQGTYTRVPKLPYIPGSDGAGIVEQIGDNIKNFSVGDRVYFSRNAYGSYAQFTLTDEQSCWPLPERLSFEQGAAIGVPYFTAFRALFQKAQAKRGQSVLVHGASGAVGLAACQLAKSHGLTVFGTAGTEEGMNIVKSEGLADKVFNHKEKNYHEKIIKQSVNEEGVDIILEMLANANLGHDLPLLKSNGVVVVVGSRGHVQINPRDLMTKETRIVGTSLFKSTPEEWKENTKAILDGLNSKKLEPVVGQIYALKDAAKAHHDIIHKPGAKGKLVLKIE